MLVLWTTAVDRYAVERFCDYVITTYYRSQVSVSDHTLPLTTRVHHASNGILRLSDTLRLRIYCASCPRYPRTPANNIWLWIASLKRFKRSRLSELARTCFGPCLA